MVMPAFLDLKYPCQVNSALRVVRMLIPFLGAFLLRMAPRVPAYPAQSNRAGAQAGKQVGEAVHGVVAGSGLKVTNLSGRPGETNRTEV